MLGRRNANGDLGHGDYVLVEDDRFGGGETPGIKKGVWAGAMQEICFDEEREREREGGFLESLQQVYFHISFVFLHGSRIPVGVLILKLTRTTGEVCWILDECSENRVLNQERKVEETKGKSDDFCTCWRMVRNIYQIW